MAKLALLLVLAGLSSLAQAVNNTYLTMEAERVTYIDHDDEEFGDRNEQEWEGYDGWYNNPAHPEWGGAGEPLAFSVFTGVFSSVYAPPSIHRFPLFRRLADGAKDARGVRGWSVRASRRKSAQRYAYC